MKTCTKCKIEKELSEFTKLKSSKDGLQYWCKNCISENRKLKGYTHQNKAQKKHTENQRKLGKCVYLHKNPTTGEVFYVGMGRECRAYNFRDRSKDWKKYVRLNSIEVDIIHKGLSFEEAAKIEIELIKKYGRKDLGQGSLTNGSDGGEGSNKTVSHSGAVKCYCLKTQKEYNSIMSFCDENGYTYTSVVRFLKRIKNEKYKKIAKDYHVREMSEKGEVIWHSTERFVRSDFEDIDNFKDLEYKEDLNFERLSSIYNDAIDSFLSLENSQYKKEHNFDVFKNIDRGMSYYEASEVLDLTYHQIYQGYNRTKDYLKNYILDRY